VSGRPAVRRATPEDAERIAAIQVAGWHAAYRGLVPDEVLAGFTVAARAPRWAELLAAAESETWLAEAGGFCTTVRPARDGWAPVEIAALYVLPERWRQGLGRALVAAAVAPTEEVTAWVLRDNAPACAFYAALGFADDGTEQPGPAGADAAEARLREDGPGAAPRPGGADVPEVRLRRRGVDREALERDLRAARGGRPPPPGMLDVATDRLAGVAFVRPRDWDLLCERGRDVPTWAIVWPSGAALAEALAAAPERLAGRRALELGCGLGVAGLVAAHAGADVLATDAAPEAVVFAKHNLRGTSARTAVLDVRAPGAPGRFDVVMTADLLYDRGNVAPLLEAVPRLLAPGGEVWLADPGRPGLAELRAGAAERWRGIDLKVVLAPAPATHRRA